MWVGLIDRILDARGDRKGIIHTTSFERARYLQQYSRHSGRLLLNESRNTRDVVSAFKSTQRPMVLVSPSVTTGYDFPYAECEFQVIGKVPYPGPEVEGSPD
jgi:ATP-dependent DNA helicase DinG